MECGVQHQTTTKCTKMLRKCVHCEEPHSSNDRKCKIVAMEYFKNTKRTMILKSGRIS